MEALNPRLFVTAIALCSAMRPALGVPPDMPRLFDRPTVEALVRNVDQDHNAAILEIGYFARRNRQALPEGDGLAIVRESLQRTPAGSRRWFVLQSLLGFGSVRAGASTIPAGYDAYNVLLDKASEAPTAHATDVVERAIYEIVATVPGEYGVRSPYGQITAGSMLLKALKVQIGLLRAGCKTPLPIPWGSAVQAAVMGNQARPLVEASLKDPAMPRSYDFCMLSAAVLSTSDGDQAEKLVKEAATLARGSLEQQQANRAMVGQLVSNKKPEEAIAVQRKWVQTTGTEYANLIRLLWAAGDLPGIDAQMSALEQPTANEGEINSTAAAMVSLVSRSASGENLRDRATSLLDNYLAAKRLRDVKQELLARITLSSIDLTKRQTDQARRVIEAGLALQPRTLDAKFAYAVLQREYHQLQRSSMSVPIAGTGGRQ